MLRIQYCDNLLIYTYDNDNKRKLASFITSFIALWLLVCTFIIQACSLYVILRGDSVLLELFYRDGLSFTCGYRLNGRKRAFKHTQ